MSPLFLVLFRSRLLNFKYTPCISILILSFYRPVIYTPYGNFLQNLYSYCDYNVQFNLTTNETWRNYLPSKHENYDTKLDYFSKASKTISKNFTSDDFIEILPADLGSSIIVDSLNQTEICEEKDMICTNATFWQYPKVRKYSISGSGTNFSATVVTTCPNDCSGRGQCNTYQVSPETRVSACICKSFYTGISCQMDMYALSKFEEIYQYIFLVASNIAFLKPAIYAWRKNYIPDFCIYTLTMLVSALYHSCDQQKTLFSFCILPDSFYALQMCDFGFSSIAIWYALLRLVNISETFLTILQYSAIALQFFMAEYDRFNPLVYVIPVIISGLLLIFRRKPDTNWTNFKIGVMFAVFGLLFKILLENDSLYWLFHSLWHACMGISLSFILSGKVNIFRHPWLKHSILQQFFTGSSNSYLDTEENVPLI